ncbi:MAG: hypothetical protein J6386_25035 [Candidatus Synoicihabitans palmerolidicus]|nr:hypothetical protein [Candidatus Synoicihabitans palmerolidicus]
MVNLGQLTDYAFYHLGHERVMGGVLGRKFQLEVIGNPEWIGEFEANEANWELANYQFALTTSPAGARLTKSNSAHSTRGVNIAQATMRSCSPHRSLKEAFLHIMLLRHFSHEDGFKRWREAFKNRYHPRNMLRHMKILRSRLFS